MNTLSMLLNLDSSNAGKKLFSFLGQIFDILIITVPIILILYGTIDFIKAVISQKDDEMKKVQNTFIKRVIIGVSIFFVPTIVNFLMVLVGFNNSSPYFNCFMNPTNCNITEFNELQIPVNSSELNTIECKDSPNRNLCCKEQNGIQDSEGIWIWNDDFGCKNTTASNPD